MLELLLLDVLLVGCLLLNLRVSSWVWGPDLTPLLWNRISGLRCVDRLSVLLMPDGLIGLRWSTEVLWRLWRCEWRLFGLDYRGVFGHAHRLVFSLLSEFLEVVDLLIADNFTLGHIVFEGGVHTEGGLAVSELEEVLEEGLEFEMVQGGEAWIALQDLHCLLNSFLAALGRLGCGLRCVDGLLRPRELRFGRGRVESLDRELLPL